MMQGGAAAARTCREERGAHGAQAVDSLFSFFASTSMQADSAQAQPNGPTHLDAGNGVFQPLFRHVTAPRATHNTARRTPPHSSHAARHAAPPTLMYAIVFSRRGLTTCSSALTRRLVVLIASSSVRKAVCSEASSTSRSTAVTKDLLQGRGGAAEVGGQGGRERKSRRSACGTSQPAQAGSAHTPHTQPEPCPQTSRATEARNVHAPALLDLLAACAQPDEPNLGVCRATRLPLRLKLGQPHPRHVVGAGLDLEGRLQRTRNDELARDERGHELARDTGRRPRSLPPCPRSQGPPP